MSGPVDGAAAPQNPPASKASKETGEVLIDHAHRLWEAECENARRIAQRTQIVAGGCVAMLGLGLFGFDWTYETPSAAMVPGWTVVVVHLLLLGALLFFGVALGILYIPSASAKGTATEGMEFEVPDAGQPVRSLVFRKVYSAYFDLKDRNGVAWLRLKRGQEWFTRGVVLIFLAIFLYHIPSIPARMHPKGSQDDQPRAVQADEQSRAVRAPPRAGDGATGQGQP